MERSDSLKELEVRAHNLDVSINKMMRTDFTKKKERRIDLGSKSKRYRDLPHPNASKLSFIENTQPKFKEEIYQEAFSLSLEELLALK